MNKEEYILAALKRLLAGNPHEYCHYYEILAAIAKIEADAVLGEEPSEVKEEE